MIVRQLIKWGMPILAAFTVMAVADSAAAQSCPDECPPPPCDDGCPPPEPPPPPPPPPCDDGCPPPPCDDGCEPPPPPPCEETPHGCQPPGPPGVNIDIDIDMNSSASAVSRAQARVDSFAAGRGVGSGAGLGSGSGLGRGYASFGVQSPAPTAMSGFVVQGPARVIRVPYRAQRSMMRRVTISAVCIDARNVPHPASRLRPDEMIADDYDGELYRCITGAWLRVTMSNFEGYEAAGAWCISASSAGGSSYQQSSYSREQSSQSGGYSQGGHGHGYGQGGGYAQGGYAQSGGYSQSGGSSYGSSYGGSAYQCRGDAPPDCIRASQGAGGMPDFCLTGGGGGNAGNTMDCRPGEALYHGRGGRLECRPQTQERDCFERSLLRRYGAGNFVLTMMREESYEEWREETVVETYSGMNVVFDGGVGGRVY